MAVDPSNVRAPYTLVACFEPQSGRAAQPEARISASASQIALEQENAMRWWCGSGKRKMPASDHPRVFWRNPAEQRYQS